MTKREWLIRFRGNLTQEQAALLTGVSRSTYSNYELGNRTPDVSTARKIGKALKFDWHLFFDEECAELKQTQPA